MAPASQHFVQRDDPDVLIKAVLAMLSDIRLPG
jgi:hypothetical protein